MSGLISGIYQPLLTNPVTGTGIINHVAYWNSSSGIAADSGQLVWDSANNRLGIGIVAPSSTLDVIGESRMQGFLYFNQNNTDATDASRNRCSITREGGQQLILRGGSNSLNLSGDGGKIIIRSSTVGTEIGGDGANTYVSFHPGSNVEKARITPAGLVGIGTSTPSGQLHVIGSGFFSAKVGIGTGVQALSPTESLVVDGNIRLADTATTQGNMIQFNRGGGTVYDYTIGRYGSLALAISLANDSNSQRPLQIGYHSGSTFVPKVHINSYTGAIGIGTTTPTAALHVIGTSGIKVGDSSANSYIYGPSGNAHIHLNQSTNNILLNSSVYAGSSVSINTQSTNLNSGAIYINGTLAFPKTGTATSTATQKNPNAIYMYSSLWNGSSAHDGLSSIESIVSTTVNGQSRLAFLVNNGDGTINRTERLSVSSSGYVGINQTNPSYALDVVGTGNFSQNLLVNGTGVSLSGHTHTSSNITDFNSSVSGLLPTINNSGDNRILTSTGSSTGINAESNLTFDGATLNIDGNLVFDSFTESVVAIGNSSTSQTISLTSGTVQTCTLTNNCIFTMPTTTAGKSFTMFLNTGSGNYTASFSGVLWSDSTPPTITTTANKVDILSFISDGNYWYGSYSQNYG